MENPIMQMMLNQLQMKNPQMFQAINQARNNGINPQNMLKQMIGQSSPQEMQDIIKQAKSMGCPDNILNQIQNFNK